MKKKQRTYLLVCLLIVSGSLFAVNHIHYPLSEFAEYVKIATTIFLLISLITLIVHLIKKTTNTFKSSLVILLIFFVLNCILIYDVIQYEILKHELAKINEIDSCEKAKEQFQKDLKEGELKYFLFGMGVDEEISNKLKNEYDLNVYGMGCIVDFPLECYNNLVEEYITKKTNKEFEVL